MELRNPLPNKLFKVRVPVIATYSQEEIQEFNGIPIDTRNGEATPGSINEMITVMLPLKRIIEIYSQGYKILMPDRNDVNKMYKILDNYIHRRDNTSEYVLNNEAPREDDIEYEIEKFAEEMFNINRTKIVKDVLNASKGFQIMGGGFMSPAQYQPKQPTTVENTNPVTFVNNSLPDIDISKIKRVKPKRSTVPHISLYDNELDDEDILN